MRKLGQFIKNVFTWFRILTLGSFLVLVFFIFKNVFAVLRRGDTTPVWNDIQDRFMHFSFGGRKFLLKGRWMGYATEIYGRKAYFPSTSFEFREGMTIVDIGASGGVYSIPAAIIGTNVVSIEADKETVAWLKENAERNNCANKMKIIWGLAGSVDSVNAENMAIFQASSPDVLPPTLDMNEVLRNIETIHILKVDIEGSEFDLFSKNNKWLLKAKRIAMEIHGNNPKKYTELRDTLLQLGFSVRLTDSHGVTHTEIDGSEYYLFAEA